MSLESTRERKHGDELRVAVRHFVTVALLIKTRKTPSERDVDEIILRLVAKVQNGRADSEPFAWKDARALLDEAARWQLAESGHGDARS